MTIAVKCKKCGREIKYWRGKPIQEAEIKESDNFLCGSCAAKLLGL